MMYKNSLAICYYHPSKVNNKYVTIQRYIGYSPGTMCPQWQEHAHIHDVLCNYRRNITSNIRVFE